jgi:KipI family sensor histidine kinase inhibitor
MYERPRYLLAGDQGLAVEFGDAIDPATNRRVHDLCLALDAARVPGILDLVPTYRSLLITYDPLVIGTAALEEAIEQVERGLSAAPAPSPRVLLVPTAYGGDFGPDLPFVASHNGLTEDEVVRIHAGTDYLVYMMGFSSGFPYLGGMSKRIATPRLTTPRTAIPAGSVGIAQTQTGIYPVQSPGGWQLIGRTPVVLFDERRQPPVLVEAGDYIRFVPISPREYEEVAAAIAAGTWKAQG